MYFIAESVLRILHIGFWFYTLTFVVVIGMLAITKTPHFTGRLYITSKKSFENCKIVEVPCYALPIDVINT